MGNEFRDACGLALLFVMLFVMWIGSQTKYPGRPKIMDVVHLRWPILCYLTALYIIVSVGLYFAKKGLRPRRVSYRLGRFSEDLSGERLDISLEEADE